MKQFGACCTWKVIIFEVLMALYHLGDDYCPVTAHAVMFYPLFIYCCLLL